MDSNVHMALVARDPIECAPCGDNVEKGGYVGSAGGRKKGQAQREAIFLKDEAVTAMGEESMKGIGRTKRRREGEIVGGIK